MKTSRPDGRDEAKEKHHEHHLSRPRRGPPARAAAGPRPERAPPWAAPAAGRAGGSHRGPHAARSRLRDEPGATTAEYATVTGCGVGFAAVLFKFLTSEGGQQLLKLIFSAIKALLPF